MHPNTCKTIAFNMLPLICDIVLHCLIKKNTACFNKCATLVKL